MIEKIKLLIKTEFGIEAVTKRELKTLGYNIINTDNGRITIEATIKDIAVTNIKLRTAERVLILNNQFKAFTFEHLFQGTKAVTWEKWLVPSGRFVVKGRSKNSKLHSVPSCQSIIKKAIIERLSSVYRRTRFPENGPEYVIDFFIEKDIVTLALDTSGAGLHKRGYRQTSGVAPLKETLAASMVLLSYWRPHRLLLDPMCGSGTIAIEAAMVGRNIPPGLNRKFAAESWGTIDQDLWQQVRSEALAEINHDLKLKIKASDINSQLIEIAKENADQAGVAADIVFTTGDIADIDDLEEYEILITNPPYGERIGSDAELEQIEYTLKELMFQHRTWSFYIVTADPNFEKTVNRKADRKRKLYNGRIKVDYYQFYGPRPVSNT